MHEESFRQIHRQKTQYAKELRREMTAAETLLWEALRDRGCAGLKFRRQVPMGEFIVDFLCREQRLIVEIDGEIHQEQAEYDDWRTADLEKHGYRVLRFSNAEVMQNLTSVLDKIRSHALTNTRTFPFSGEANGRVGEGVRG